MVDRNVDYEMELVDDIPDFIPNSPLEDQLRRIQYDPERHAPRWARIGRYYGDSHAAAAGSAASTLRKRHGDTQGVEGWQFQTRRIENGQASGLFAQYNPNSIEPGLREENDRKYEIFKEKQRDRARLRAERKMAVSDST